MTTKKIFLTAAIIFTFKSSSAQITFQKTFGGTGVDIVSFAQQTTDRGYIIVGQTQNFGAGDFDVYLIKTDSTGDTVWTKTFGGISLDQGSSLQQTADGGYVITGSTYSFGAGAADVYLIKTNATGDTMWTKTFGGTSADYGYSVRQTLDGGYIISGRTTSFGSGSNDVYLINTNSTGDTLWTKTYGGISEDDGYDVRQTSDSGYIITGITNSFGAGVFDTYFIKTNATGNILWSKTFGGGDNDAGTDVRQTADGGYIIVGATTSFGTGQVDIYLVKTDASGDTLWTKTYGGTYSSNSSSIQQTTDGGYIIAGETGLTLAVNNDVNLIKTNATGDTLWTKNFGGPGDDYGRTVQQTADGGYIIAAYTYSFGAGSSDFYLIKTDANGNSGCNQTNPTTIVTTPTTQLTSPITIVSSTNTIATTSATIVGSGGVDSTLCTTVGIAEIKKQQSTISIYPNPFLNEFKINSTKENAEIVLYDLTGKEILKERTLSGETILNTTKIATGFYILHYIEGNRIENIKLTKM